MPNNPLEPVDVNERQGSYAIPGTWVVVFVDGSGATFTLKDDRRSRTDWATFIRKVRARALDGHLGKIPTMVKRIGP